MNSESFNHIGGKEWHPFVVITIIFIVAIAISVGIAFATGFKGFNFQENYEPATQNYINKNYINKNYNNNQL